MLAFFVSPLEVLSHGAFFWFPHRPGDAYLLGVFNMLQSLSFMRRNVNGGVGRVVGKSTTMVRLFGTTMRAKLIGHFQTCMTDIYLHIDARMTDYIRTHP
eukprot:COSAG05_NODE_230_length_13364_cov_33.748662_14_plen_100_part_00